MQAASYFVTRWGFEPRAYQGMETGSRIISSHVSIYDPIFHHCLCVLARRDTSRRPLSSLSIARFISGLSLVRVNGAYAETSQVVANKAAIFVFMSPNQPPDYVETGMTKRDKQLLRDIHDHIDQHGDAVKDVAFGVDNVNVAYNTAVDNGAVSVQTPSTLSDKDGEVVTAVIKTFGDTTHTLVERCNYRGAFLPGYQAVNGADPVNDFLPAIEIEVIDHCVGNQNWDQLQEVCE